MANCYHHSVSSAKHFGGKAEDYQAIHDWFDESKKIMADFRHRALRHHAEGCFACEEKFGTTITNSDGKKVPVRLIAERHIKEDLGFIPSMIDWFKWIQPQKFSENRLYERRRHNEKGNNMKLKDFNTEEHFKQSFKKVFGEDIDISLDTTFGELAEMQRLILEKAENQESQ